MKRETYTITCGDMTRIKYKWNSALAEMCNMVRILTRDLPGEYNRETLKLEKDRYGSHVYGEFVWSGPKSHNLTFTIKKEA